MASREGSGLGLFGQPCRDGPHEADHHGAEYQRERDDHQPVLQAASRRPYDERQQAPRRRIACRRAGERDAAERRYLSDPRSFTMRASTGNAVIDIATPMNRANVVNGTSLDERRG